VEQRRSIASRAECFLVGVGDLADGELAWSAATATAQWQCRRRGPAGTLLNYTRRFEPSRRSELPSRYKLPPSFWTGCFGFLTRQRRAGLGQLLSVPCLSLDLVVVRQPFFL